jgi:hypothetical protein
MSAKVVAALSLVALFSLSSALASSITNRDDMDYKVTIVEGPTTKHHILEPSGALQEVCERGCVVRLNDDQDEAYELKGSEVVVIEDGNLFYDAAAGGSAAPDSDDAEKPFEPGDR